MPYIIRFICDCPSEELLGMKEALSHECEKYYRVVRCIEIQAVEGEQMRIEAD